jgi:phenylacetic acid degradation operon negative regulatory protein
MTTALALRPLSARSVVLSLLLGAHPAELSAAALVRAGELFEVPETTLRAALSRMVAAGDLVRDDSTYALSERLLQRQRRQDLALDVETTAWDGSWEQVVITSSGRSAQERAELRATLTSLRLAELREGVWMRPANLARPLPGWPAELISTFRATPDEDAAVLSRRLWDVDGWAAHGRALLDGLASADRARDRLTLSAAVVRHLLRDPALPEALLPEAWPSIPLRERYADYQAELIATTRGS